VSFGAAAFGQEWPGQYRALGHNDQGGQYSGTMAIAPYGEGLAGFWRIDKSGEKYQGVGVAEGDALAIAYSATPGFGVVLYRYRDGRWEGRWILSDDAAKKVNPEILTGPEEISGTHRIISAHESSGRSYSGRVDVVPRGQVYAVRWRIYGHVIEGVGVRRGDLFAVAYGRRPRDQVGVVLYRPEQGALKGVWAAVGMTQTGDELLVREK
jgi:hypothetical protein